MPVLGFGAAALALRLLPRRRARRVRQQGASRPPVAHAPSRSGAHGLVGSAQAPRTRLARAWSRSAAQITRVALEHHLVREHAPRAASASARAAPRFDCRAPLLASAPARAPRPRARRRPTASTARRSAGPRQARESRRARAMIACLRAVRASRGARGAGARSCSCRWWRTCGASATSRTAARSTRAPTPRHQEDGDQEGVSSGWRPEGAANGSERGGGDRCGGDGEAAHHQGGGDGGCSQRERAGGCSQRGGGRSEPGDQRPPSPGRRAAASRSRTARVAATATAATRAVAVVAAAVVMVVERAGRSARGAGGGP